MYSVSEYLQIYQWDGIERQKTGPKYILEHSIWEGCHPKSVDYDHIIQWYQMWLNA